MAILTINTAIINYPGAMQSAVIGLRELFELANVICEKRRVKKQFVVEQYEVSEFYEAINLEKSNKKAEPSLQIIIIPPAMENSFCLNPSESLKHWIIERHAEGTLICSICAGAFLLAATGIIKQRRATTHWNLAGLFSDKYPEVNLDVDKILINDGDIITAGGLMSWVDLGLELVKQFLHGYVMRELGKQLVVDTGTREQAYYQVFSPRQDHADKAIVKAQHYIQKNYGELLTINQLSQHCLLAERTFLRRFFSATGYKPTEYIQRIRIQNACELIETSRLSFEIISLKVGYQDVGAFRNKFKKFIKLTPGAFKAKFSQNTK